MNKISFYLPSIHGGGAERVMLLIARHFSESGRDVDLVLSEARGEYAYELVSSKMNVVDLKSKKVSQGIFKLVKYLKSERPEVLVTTLNHTSVMALWAKKISGVDTRIVVREANTPSVKYGCPHGFADKLMPLMMRCFYPWADKIIAVSEGVADDLETAVRLPRSRIRVIANPVVTQDMYVESLESADHPWLEEDGNKVVLAAGSLSKQKDFTTLIRAFSILVQSCEARLIILGEGGERRALQELIESLRLEGRVCMPGFKKNIFSYMRRSSLFVLSSIYEGLPNVLIQAMALGVPVVSTDCRSGPREILENGRYGALVPVGHADAMAVAMKEKLFNPGDVEEVSKIVAHKYSGDRMTRAYEDCIFNAVEGEKG